MPDKPTIELPRLPEESARAYAARLEYVTAGPQRSLEKLLDRPQSASKSPPTRRLETLKDWSVRYGWSESARQYDDDMALITIQEAQDAYRADLADYRKRYGEMGKALYMSAAKLVKKINAMLDTMEMVNPGSLLTAMNAAKCAADLEAIALRVESLLQADGQEDAH